jgi:protein-S-isoprenylcysteine O-methyltransferase Ste14
MWILIRAVVYATFFVGLLLIFLPARILSISGFTPSPAGGIFETLGIFLATIGASLGTWCILTFVFVGKGTQAPFDPPRRLVVRGPYRIVRNPMYIGAGLVLAGAASYYRSIVLLAYAIVFWFLTNLAVIFLEEPALRRSFGNDYDNYCSRVGRWLPKVRA